MWTVYIVVAKLLPVTITVFCENIEIAAVLLLGSLLSETCMYATAVRVGPLDVSYISQANRMMTKLGLFFMYVVYCVFCY